MRTPQQLLDGLGFAANTAAGLGRGLGEEIKNLVDSKVKRHLARMNLVTREEHDALRAMVAEMRQQQEDLRSAPQDTGESQDKARDQ